MEQLLKLLPKLSNHLRKGDCGKIGIIGGSMEYTGAPYFAASSAARLGADLIHVFCTHDAATVIKTYSPDLIVHPGMKVDDVIPKLERLTTLAFLSWSRKKELPLVIDGDGLWFVAEDSSLLPKSESIVLTPNVVEFSRLCKAVLKKENVLDIKDFDEIRQLAANLSREMRVAIYLKGNSDLVVTPDGRVSKCDAKGSMRRCGGQGDVTAGTLGLLLSWARKTGADWTTSHHDAGVASSWLVRTAGHRAFEREGRSMNTPNLLEELPRVLRDVETAETVPNNKI
ncbi:unnamed protein product [Caenorhabditis auriculariae]|uniref:ATP-dependent (S)-NAD(P)H-hydrate dehydratase n=1 Tax=Caenorhabditis auriculariae TaxID=2777116 RepID=A0A8S1GSR8_9PELO|nr:unnamed protein product [Caenorhabditis auriculariae]